MFSPTTFFPDIILATFRCKADQSFNIIFTKYWKSFLLYVIPPTQYARKWKLRSVLFWSIFTNFFANLKITKTSELIQLVFDFSSRFRTNKFCFKCTQVLGRKLTFDLEMRRQSCRIFQFYNFYELASRSKLTFRFSTNLICGVNVLLYTC